MSRGAPGRPQQEERPAGALKRHRHPDPHLTLLAALSFFSSPIHVRPLPVPRVVRLIRWR